MSRRIKQSQVSIPASNLFCFSEKRIGRIDNGQKVSMGDRRNLNKDFTSAAEVADGKKSSAGGFCDKETLSNVFYRNQHRGIDLSLEVCKQVSIKRLFEGVKCVGNFGNVVIWAAPFKVSPPTQHAEHLFAARFALRCQGNTSAKFNCGGLSMVPIRIPNLLRKEKYGGDRQRDCYPSAECRKPFPKALFFLGAAKRLASPGDTQENYRDHQDANGPTPFVPLLAKIHSKSLCLDPSRKLRAVSHEVQAGCMSRGRFL
jgi:hypothetical protein